MNKLTQKISLLSEKVSFPETIIWFKRLMWLYLIFQTIWYLPMASQLFGPEAWFPPYYNSTHPVLYILNLLEKDNFQPFYLFFIWAQIASLILCLVFPAKRIWQLIALFFTYNLYHRIAPIENGGNNLLMMVFNYTLLMDPYADLKKNSFVRFINILLTNLAFYAARWQVVTLYAVASYYKLTGETWLNGTAFYYVLYNDMYSHPLALQMFGNQSFVIYLVSWFTLWFQALFPVFVWFKKTKKIMITAGILFHAAIIFVMGIVDFGIIMMLMYVLFQSEESSLKLSHSALAGKLFPFQSSPKVQ